MSNQLSPRKVNTYKRKAKIRELREKFLIVCEGEKTEPNYFKSFPVKMDLVDISVFGEGANTNSLVEITLQRIKDAYNNGTPYNQAWCVFDKDSFSDNNFNTAIFRANSKKIKVAYSNEAFELWYILHYQLQSTGISRKQYKGILTKLLGRKYEKNDEHIYEELKKLQKQAIKNAKRLLAEKYCKGDTPAKQNPTTTVQKLVQELNKYI